MQNEAITHVGIDMGMRNRVTACTIMSGAGFLFACHSKPAICLTFSTKLQNIYIVQTAQKKP